jgi:hypothetical protein
VAIGATDMNPIEKGYRKLLEPEIEDIGNKCTTVARAH